MAHEKVFVERLTCRNIGRFMSMWKHKRGLPQGDEACFHTLRHTTASCLVQCGVPLAVIQKWVGHAVIEAIMKYAHLAPDSLDLALAALNRRPDWANFRHYYLASPYGSRIDHPKLHGDAALLSTKRAATPSLEGSS